MTIQDIYTTYHIPKHLQDHMLQVAAISSYIWTHRTSDTPLDLKRTITAWLIHDLGNLVKFDFDTMPNIFQDDIDIYRDLQKKWHDIYGTDDIQATLAIAKEIWIPSKTMSMIMDTDEYDGIEDLLFHYSDRRVWPYGVLSIEQRMQNLRQRYPNKLRLQDGTRQANLALRKHEEQLLFTHCSLEPDDINDESISTILEELRSWEIV